MICFENFDYLLKICRIGTALKVSVFGVILYTFFRILTEYGEILRISSYSVQNADQNNSEYEHFLRSVELWQIFSWNLIQFI